MKFGIFDHVDSSNTPLHEHFENRLKLTELYDRLGFYCYHIAEHHFTPLGYAPSPGILLSSVAQRTRRLKFGPLVYLLPLYHPLRLIEEICILDQISQGRFQLGVGRGVSPFELGYYGVDHEQSAEMYHEAYQVLMQGFASDELTFSGRYYNFNKVPMELKPFQRPHPPLWYGAGTENAMAWCAANGVNIVTIGNTRRITDRYRAEWAALGKDPRDLPLLGVSRHIVVAETDKEAKAIARRAYPHWRRNLEVLWKRNGASVLRLGEVYPDTWDDTEALGNCCAGSPARVRDYVRGMQQEGGVNYFCSWYQYGDMTLPEASRSVTLFAEQVMPAFEGA